MDDLATKCNSHSCCHMKYKDTPIDDISIFKTPVIYLQLLSALVVDLVRWFKNLLLRRGLAMISFVGVWMLITNLEALQVQDYLSRISKIYVILQSTGLYLELPLQLA